MSEGAKNAKKHFEANASICTVLKFTSYLFNAKQNSHLASEIRIFLLSNDHFPLKGNV